MEFQESENPATPFSYLNSVIPLASQQIQCHGTWTNEKTHEVIRKNDNRQTLPTFIGNGGKGQGPRYACMYIISIISHLSWTCFMFYFLFRYCVSIEGKIRRFTTKVF